MARRSVTAPVTSDEQEPIEIRSRMLSGAPVPEAEESAEPMSADTPGEGSGSLTPDLLRAMVAADEQRREIIRDFIARNLRAGTDFGTISSGGRESKPSLFKPGAEKICQLFGWRPKFSPDLATLGMAGHPPGLFVYLCRLIDGQGHVVGEGRGAAELTEREGWTVNNAIKICEKRAHVDAVLRVAGLSEIFTQDLEDIDQRRAFEQESGSRPAPAPPPMPVAVAAEPVRAPREEPAPARPAPVREEAPTRPAPVADLAASAADSEGDDLCTEQQQRAIRALLPKAGIAEDELVSKLRIDTIAELTRSKATKVIDRLTTNARDRQKAVG